MHSAVGFNEGLLSLFFGGGVVREGLIFVCSFGFSGFLRFGGDFFNCD